MVRKNLGSSAVDGPSLRIKIDFPILADLTANSEVNCPTCKKETRKGFLSFAFVICL
ncbi:hypothetical protein HY449_04425 [Candidatus Pacearchaeota archaeon]|nr:hypothetical protein [Candidatus Pacearchaeota archaeon]